MADQNSTLVILAQAMDIEREGLAFYGKAAESSSNGRAKEIFRSLVTDEAGHLQMLQAEYDSQRGAGKWLPAESVLKGKHALHLFPKGPEALKKTAASPGDLEALQFAMAIEQKGYDLYVSAGESTANADGKSLFRFLAKMENRHYKILQDAYGLLTHPDYWYDDEEQPFFEGG